MKIFQLIIILALVLTANKTSACLDAYQSRVFPLGTCDQGLIVLELDMKRHEAKGTPMEKMVTAWSGISYLRIYNKENVQVHSEIIDSSLELMGSTYVEDLSKTFSQAELRAKKHTDFRPAKVKDFSFYHYEKSDEYNLEADTIAIQLFLTTKEMDRMELTILSDSCSFSKKYLRRTSRYATDEDMVKENNKNTLKWMSISSLRTYKIGKKTFTVVHLGSGQRLESADGIYRPNTSKVPVNGQLFNEPILHHGQGFDYIIWN